MSTASALHRQLTFQPYIFAYTPSAFTTRFHFFHLHYTFLLHPFKPIDFMLINKYNGHLAIHDHFLYQPFQQSRTRRISIRLAEMKSSTFRLTTARVKQLSNS